MSLLKTLFSSMDRYETCPKCGTNVRLNCQKGNEYWYGTCPECKNRVMKSIPKN